jgi:hypothetical protein
MAGLGTVLGGAAEMLVNTRAETTRQDERSILTCK